MRAPSHSADRISTCALLVTGGLGGVVLVSVVALPLAFSSPFPTPREGGEWIIANPPLSVHWAKAAVEGPEEQQTDPMLVMAALEGQGDQPFTFAERWNYRVPQAPIVSRAPDEPPAAELSEPASRAPAPPEAAPEHPEPKLHPTPPAKAAAPAPKRAPPVDPVEQYLWQVYLRKPVKSDSTGDFTWKDQAAAKRLAMSLRTYVIGGMDPDFREQLYHAGHAMDADGLRWSILSAFRDDYRQGLAAGFKAHGGNSLHGGSRATGGYGHGRAIDITSAEGESEAVWHWIDAHGSKYGLLRPMTRIDPAHIQARGSYHDLAHDLREARIKLENKLNGATAAALSKTRMAARMEK